MQATTALRERRYAMQKHDASTADEQIPPGAAAEIVEKIECMPMRPHSRGVESHPHLQSA